MAFPLGFMSVLYLVLVVFIYLNFKKKHHNIVTVIILFVSTVLITFFAADLYFFINSFNPYES